jgi:hypothetical protein
METKKFAICLVLLMLLSPILVGCAVADEGRLNLLSTPVMIEVIDGTESYFNTTLSGVPSGYDVTNGTYLGWCIDITRNMARSPATHEVTLYSSINPPGAFAKQSWSMVNYILNHKQGTADDIQQAIWYFINFDGNCTPTSTVASAIVNDARANGTGFVPAYGQTIAVICNPVILFPGEEVQISIIELSNTVIPEFPSLAIPLSLLALATLSAAVVYRKKRQKTTDTHA